MARFSNRGFGTMAACLAILLLVILLVVLWTGGWYGRDIETNQKRINVLSEVNKNERRANFSNDLAFFEKSINESSYKFLPSVELHSTIFERVLVNLTTTTATTNEVPIEDKVERIKHNESLPDVFPSAKGDLEYIMPMKISQNQYEDPPDPSTSPKRHHSGHFRHSAAEVWDPHPQYEFTAFGRFFRLRLAHDTSFISPDIKVTHISANTSRRVHPGHQLDCFYNGHIDGDLDSVVTVNLCHGMLCQLTVVDFELQTFVPILQMLIPSICYICLYFTTLMHHVTVQKIYSYIKQDWQRLRNNVEIRIMEKHAKESKLFTLTCGFLFYVYVSLIVSPFLLRVIMSTNEATSNTDHFPIFSCINYILNRDTYYFVIVIYQTILIVVSITVGIACYSTYFIVIQHTCARLSIVKDEMQRPFTNADDNENVLEKPLDLSDWMIDIIRHLSRTAKLMKLVNRLGEKNYLLQIMLAFVLVVIDFLCIPTLLEHKETVKDIFPFITYMFTTLIPIYVNCYIGQRLIDYSSDMYKEACLIPIHELSLKTQRLLLTTLMMSQKPYAISIGKVFISSHEFFSNLVRTSLSFAMILHSIQNV